MRKLTAFIFSIIMIFTTGIPICANENSKWKYEIKSDNTAKIVEYTSDDKKVSVPSTVDGYTVTEIGSTSFYDSDIEEVILPETIKTISWWAFYGCDNLVEVKFNDGLNTIEHGAFMNCKKLKKINLPSTILKIGEDAFAVNCTTKTGIKDKYSEELVSKQTYSVTKNFEISGYSGTVSEKYADESNLDFNSKGNLLFGDTNLDGKITEEDIILLEDYIEKKVKLVEIQLMNSDVNGDTKITQRDIDSIKLYSEKRILYTDFPVTEELIEYPDYFSGKSMYCEGDSVALGLGTRIFGNDYYSYCNYISEETGMKMLNTAVSGTTLAIQEEKIGTRKRSILERIRETDSNYDVVLIDGGFNDLFQSIEIGDITPISNKSGIYDEYTTAGALESICYILNTKYKDSIKLFVLCHTTVERKRQSEYWDAIRTILEKWDIPYVDLSRETEFRNDNEEITTQYFKYKEKYKKGDGVHPLKYAAQKVYGPLVLDKLYELAREKESYTFSDENVELGITERFQQLPLIEDEEILETVRWSTDDPLIAEVDKNGVVTPRAIGKTTVKAITADDKKTEYTVDIKYMAVDMRLDKLELNLYIGESGLIKANVLYNTASYYKMFTSNDESVATVTDSGIVTAVGEGNTVITCKSFNGIKVECLVNVTDKQDDNSMAVQGNT